MDDDDRFDSAVIAAVFEQAALTGWARLSVAEAARSAALDLARARLFVPSKQVALVRFGRLADAAALTGTTVEGPARDRLFDILMRRIDFLQAHRAGTLALLRWLPAEPGTALFLAALTRRSMGWMLQGAGISDQGFRGAARTKALLGVWLWTLRAWQGDDSADLSATMASLDSALRRVEQVALMCARTGRAARAGDLPPSEPEAGSEPSPPIPTPPPAPPPVPAPDMPPTSLSEHVPVVEPLSGPPPPDPPAPDPQARDPTA